MLTVVIKLCYLLCEDKIDLPHRSEMVQVLPASGQHGTFLLQQMPVSVGSRQEELGFEDMPFIRKGN